MNIVYTAHLEFRLKVRKISALLPKKVLKDAKEHNKIKLWKSPNISTA